MSAAKEAWDAFMRVLAEITRAQHEGASADDVHELFHSPMLPRLKRDADGGITLYVQNESPRADHEANWLPAPKGPFFAVMRLYWPKPEAIEGKWKAPPLQSTK